jgi:bacteriorhodopsin
MAAILLLCLVFLVVFRQRIKRQVNAQLGLPFRKRGFSFITIGGLLLLLSLIGYFNVQSDINKTIEFLRPVAWMTSEPVLALLVSAAIIAATILVLGILYLKKGSSLRGV